MEIHTTSSFSNPTLVKLTHLDNRMILIIVGLSIILFICLIGTIYDNNRQKKRKENYDILARHLFG